METNAQAAHVQFDDEVIPLEVIESEKVAEVTLSDGRFASVYKPHMKHMHVAQGHPLGPIAGLMTMIVKIDDSQVTSGMLLEMLAEDYWRIQELLEKEFNKFVK